MTGKEIKAIRLKLGMSQSGFAYALRTTATTVSRWENDKVKISEVWKMQIRNLVNGWK